MPHTVASLASESLCPLLSSTVLHCLSECHTLLFLGSVPLCPLLFSLICPMSVSTSHFTVRWFCVSMSTAVFSVGPISVSTSNSTVSFFCVTVSNVLFYSPSNVCQNLTQYRLLVLCHCVHSSILHSAQCLSLRYTVPSVGPVSLCPQLHSTVCQLSASTSHCTHCWFFLTIFFATMSTAIFYILSTGCLYVTLNKC